MICKPLAAVGAVRTRMAETLKILAVDDEPLALRRLTSLLRRLPDVEIVGAAGDGRQALAELHRLSPDVILLDIEMPSISGLEVASRIDPQDGPEIVILSAFDGYAAAAFEVEAVDYLLKPVGEERLTRALERARRRRRERAAHGLEEARTGMETASTLHIPGRHGGQSLPLALIVWIEAARDYVLLHTIKRTYILRVTMAELESRLPSTMLRVHRSAFVKIDQVQRWGSPNRGARSVVLFDGTEVPVGASYHQQAIDALWRLQVVR